MERLISDFIFIGEGLKITLSITFFGLFFGIILGTIFSILRYAGGKFTRLIVERIVSVLRGVPLLVQLSFIYFPVSMMLNDHFGIGLNVVSAGIIAFGLNSSAYVAEILRAGIENLPKGQFEAAKTLNIPKFYMWKDIILPQVVRNILPAMVNETVALLKETAIISVIGGLDIMRKADQLIAEKFTYFGPLLIAAVYYYLLVLLIEYLGKKLNKRVQNAYIT